jgi:hypothetical protein
MVNSSGSVGWSDFRRQTFGDPYLVWHDGADFTVLRQRWDTDPQHVESMLRTGLTEADPLAAQAIEVVLRTREDLRSSARRWSWRSMMQRARSGFAWRSRC